MSVRVLTKVFSRSEAKLAARLVLLALADSAHDDGVTWIDQVTIGAKALVSQATVRRAIEELVALGEVESRKAQRGRRRINIYRVVMPGLEEPDYDRLPFTVNPPFTTAHIERSPSGAAEADDRSSCASTTAHPVDSERPASFKSLEPLVNRGGAKAPPGEVAPSGPPKLHKIDGRNVAFDTLAVVCGIAPSDPNRAGEVAVALNGGKAIKVGIRALAWAEVVAAKFGGDEETALAAAAAHAAAWEQSLGDVIEHRAATYRDTMGGALLTPTALAKWWLSLDGLAATRRDGGMTPDEMRAHG